MNSLERIKTATKFLWSAILLFLATGLCLFAFAPMFSAALRGEFQSRLGSLFAGTLIFGLPGAWFAYLGFRELLAAGLVPHE